MKLNLAGIKTFFRYNIVALLATLVDFLILIILTEFFNIWYLLSATIGAISGGITAFVLGRNWAFKKNEEDLWSQVIKYAMVWMGSIFLNVAGLYLLVEFFGWQYIISKIFVTICVGIGFNYIMQKYYIFK